MTRVSAASVLRPALPTMRILWAALLASVAIIAFMTTRLPAQPDAARPMAVLVLAGVAAGCAVASFVLPAIVYAGNLRRRRPGPREAFTYRSAAAAGDPIGEFAEPDMAAVQAVASGQVAFILRLALSEAV